jgi:hypothetical protein
MCRQCGGFLVAAKQILRGARWRARRQNLQFDLTLDDVLELFGDGFCPVLGIKYDLSARTICDASPTLDKFFPDMGYVKGNCTVISQLANQIKSHATAGQVRLVAEWMLKHVRLRALQHP